MSLVLHYHPLASFCWKALIGLYEKDVAFTPLLVDLGDADLRAAFAKIWPLAKFPVLQDEARGEIIPESSVILEYLDRRRPSGVRLIPADPDAALQVRLWDRVFDNYIHVPMQRIIANRLRPDDVKDPYGGAEAQAQMTAAYDLVEARLAGREWIADDFGLADCAAAPALFYGERTTPFGERHKEIRAYLERLQARPSFARVLEEAEPYFKMFPG